MAAHENGSISTLFRPHARADAIGFLHPSHRETFFRERRRPAVHNNKSFDLSAVAPGCLSELSKQTHADVIRFIFWNAIRFGPTFLFQIRNNVLTGRECCFFSKTLTDLSNSSQMMPFSAVSHSVSFTPGKFIEPAVNFDEGFAEADQCLLTVFLKRRHTLSFFRLRGSRWKSGGLRSDFRFH